MNLYRNNIVARLQVGISNNKRFVDRRFMTVSQSRVYHNTRRHARPIDFASVEIDNDSVVEYGTQTQRSGGNITPKREGSPVVIRRRLRGICRHAIRIRE